jgi:predicted NACHT family NTPase
MVKRSLKVSEQGLIIAKKAFERRQWTQEYLAAEVGLYTRNSIWKFFSRRPIERNIFMEICFKLDLDWEEIADLPNFQDNSEEEEINLEQKASLEVNTIEIKEQSAPKLEQKSDSEINKLRQQIKGQIQAQCGTIQNWFNSGQSLAINSIYTELKATTSISNQRWLEISDLTSVKQATIPLTELLKNQHKLVIIGKPGSGKTIFLQQLALSCIDGRFKEDYLPLFIPVRYLILQGKQRQDFSVISYLKQTAQIVGILPEQIDSLALQGKLLILLDGLEEIAIENSQLILAQIQQFSDLYYQCSIIITCRSGISLNSLRNFTYIELADLDESQGRELSKKWFIAQNQESEKEALIKYSQFWEQLQRPENKSVEELTKTPILLCLLCSIFQQKSSFPTKLSRLYQGGLEILLKQEDNLFPLSTEEEVINLSVGEKIQLLSHIAKRGFEQNKFFYEQEELVNIILNYLPSLSQFKSPEINKLNGEKILQTMERQNGLLIERAKGIYSFSHSTFPEYLTARNFVQLTNNLEQKQSLQQLATKIYDYSWRQVIFLTLEMLADSAYFLEQIQQQIDSVLENNPKINQFFLSLEEKQKTLDVPYKPEAVKAFYLGLLEIRDLNLALALDVNLGSNLHSELALDVALIRALNLSLNLGENGTFEQILELGFALDIEQKFSLNQRFKQELALLKQQLLTFSDDSNNVLNWWKINNNIWVKNLRNLINKYRLIAQDWDFNQQEKFLLNQYYNAQLFLVKSLS